MALLAVDFMGSGRAQSAVLTMYRPREFFVSHEYPEKALPEITHRALLAGQMPISGQLHLALAWPAASSTYMHGRAAWVQGQEGLLPRAACRCSHPLGFQEGEE